MAGKKKRDPDYTLNIFCRYEDSVKQNVFIFLVQTTKIFTSFRYEILLEDEIFDHSIKLKITGLHVPTVLIPQTGPAQGHREYANLEGTYRVIVTKQDKTINEFKINISPSDIDIVQKPKNPFIYISNEQMNLS